MTHHSHDPAGSGLPGDESRALSPAGEPLVEAEAQSLLPRASSVLQAGAFGATLGGLSTGVMELARVRQGQITRQQALENVVKSSAQGAATMAVASVASQMVRAHPLFSVAALAAAGIGALALLSQPAPPPSPDH